MSEPAKNNEIEDVLSSIRRLVSENRSAASESVTTRSAPVSEPEDGPTERSHDRSALTRAGEETALVLTPALRVEEEAQEQRKHDPSVEQESRLSHVDQSDESSDIDAAGLENVGLEEFEAARVNCATDAFEEEPAVEDDDDIFDEDGDGPSTDIALSWEQDDNEEEVSAAEEFSHTPFPEGARHPETDESTDESHALESGDMPEQTAGDDNDTPFDFEQVRNARIVQWKDLETDGAVQEPDSPGDSDYAGTETLSATWNADDQFSEQLKGEFEDPADALQEEIISEVEDAVLPDLADSIDEAATIDEDMLREMVADIVRQELQGALGERITRNVRKLVRREIHRALAAQDLD